jgi:hypothetical protein
VKPDEGVTIAHQSASLGGGVCERISASIA